MAELVEVTALDNLKIYLKYSNGVEGEYSLEKTARKEEFSILNDSKIFQNVSIDPVTNDVSWGNGILLCKNAIYKQLELMNLASKLKLDLNKL